MRAEEVIWISVGNGHGKAWHGICTHRASAREWNTRDTDKAFPLSETRHI